jgi:acetyl esterase
MNMFEFTVEDVEYLCHGNEALLARVLTPKGEGPFPCIVEVHGGAWSVFDRTRGKMLHEALARAGVVVVALDFRQGADGAYPRSVADVNYGVRWVKANAARLQTRPDMVGLAGNSSGGHLSMLNAMRPTDFRYASISLPEGSSVVDARVRCVVMLWPVINPSGRYRYAQRAMKNDLSPEWAATVIKVQDAYWGSEANMAEGNPMLALERAEAVDLPPALWVQNLEDEFHNYRDEDSPVEGREMERFAANYRRAGGTIELLYFEGKLDAGARHPTFPDDGQTAAQIVDFVQRQIPPAQDR